MSGKTPLTYRNDDSQVRRLAMWLVFVAIPVITFVGLRSAAADPAALAEFEWLRHARIFILDAYAYPLAPKIEFDAEKLGATMADMHTE